MDLSRIFSYINWLDILTLLIILKGIYSGVQNGLTAELFGFIGVITSAICAIHWYNKAAEVFIVNLSLPSWISQGGCILAIVIIIRYIFKYSVVLVLKVMNVQFLPQLEKMGGVLLGIGKGVITSGILVLVLNLIPSGYMQESIYEKSFVGAFLIQVIQRTYTSLTFWIPESSKEKSIFSVPIGTAKKQKKR